jgi:hypothetical protein
MYVEKESHLSLVNCFTSDLIWSDECAVIKDNFPTCAKFPYKKARWNSKLDTFFLKNVFKQNCFLKVTKTLNSTIWLKLNTGKICPDYYGWWSKWLPFEYRTGIQIVKAIQDGSQRCFNNLKTGPVFGRLILWNQASEYQTI